MTSLETQLLKIIEEQQQLKQQQHQQYNALQILEMQTGTISQLQRLTSSLEKKNKETEQIVKRYQEIVKKLSEQTVSEHFSEALQTELKELLKTLLTKLVSSLDLKKEAKDLILIMLPSLVQAELEKQTQALAQRLEAKLDSVSSYHEDLRDLAQSLSERLP